MDSQDLHNSNKVNKILLKELLKPIAEQNKKLIEFSRKQLKRLKK